MKTDSLFYFEDEPQFATHGSRSWTANYLRACRNARGNLGMRPYRVTRHAPGHYSVQLQYTGSPIAILKTR
jgi:hypothetical protein